MARMVMGVVVVLIWAMLLVVQVPEVAAKRWTVGDSLGWTPNYNYTDWTKDKKFYNGDWLDFVYDKTNLFNVLEVNQTNYESCNSNAALHNWTTGSGKDEVHLNETRHYYFIGTKGLCQGGMKLAVPVENAPPPPSSASPSSASPSSSSSSSASANNETTSDSPTSLYRGHIALPAVFAIGALWEIFLGFC